ncbi:MAG: hypothetical protein A2Y21_01605 [Clostridiales bacterium GWC2_40_7]|nr:MAG: hypothetical protein A2Y21_01605 [Clostridiales bacterium GWC2_40_7]
MVFKCTIKTSRRKERWTGNIVEFKKHGSHYEMRIDSRSGILVIFGRTTQGGFACMPDFGAGCHLVNLKDRFWNTEKLTEVLGKVDGITVAEALFAISDAIDDLDGVKSI